MAYESSFTLPFGEGGHSGEIASADYFRTLTAAMNAASVHNSAQPISQGWPDGTCSHSGSTVEAFRWRIPLADTSKSVLRLTVDAEGAGIGSGVLIESVGGNSQKTVLFSGRETKFCDLLVGQGAAGFNVNSDFDEILFSLIADGGSLTIYSVDSAYLPSAQVVNSHTYTADGSALPFYRIGSNVLADSSSISSFIGHATSANITALTSRLRSLGSWSAFGPDAGSLGWYGTARSPRLMMIQPGTMTAGQPIQCHIRTVNTTDDPEVLTLITSTPSGRTLQALDVTIPANQAPTWSVHTLHAFEAGRIPNSRRELTPEPYLALSVDTLKLNSRALISLSAWCE